VEVVAEPAADVVLAEEAGFEAGAIRLVACCKADDILGVLPELASEVVFPPCLD
jgi:hypothetical protein